MSVLLTVCDGLERLWEVNVVAARTVCKASGCVQQCVWDESECLCESTNDDDEDKQSTRWSRQSMNGWDEL
jgi:hypothetical protein